MVCPGGRQPFLSQQAGHQAIQQTTILNFSRRSNIFVQQSRQHHSPTAQKANHRCTQLQLLTTKPTHQPGGRGQWPGPAGREYEVAGGFRRPLKVCLLSCHLMRRKTKTTILHDDEIISRLCIRTDVVKTACQVRESSCPRASPMIDAKAMRLEPSAPGPPAQFVNSSAVHAASIDSQPSNLVIIFNAHAALVNV